MAALRRGMMQFNRSTARFKDHRIHGNSNLDNCGLLRPFQLVSARGIVSKLFVGGLSSYTTEDSLSEAFSQFGQVIEAKIIMDKVSKRSKGFGFVTFASEDEAQKALAEMDRKVLNGRVIFIEHAKVKLRFDDAGPIAIGLSKPPGSQ
ncbi:unnamed protein product [Musa hybrid cultivar]